jgi:fructokinase
MKKLVVGLGEVLWDVLPKGKHLGGAPANFAYITTLLGDEGIVASRVGSDENGSEATHRMRELGLPCSFIQRDVTQPTGIVKVELDYRGAPRFQIQEPSAWDFFEWTPEWQSLAQKADAVCFGSLAQRSAASRETIRQFLAATRPDAVRIFDVNLRGFFYSPEVLMESMKRATLVKMNDEEVPKVMALCGLEHHDEEASARRLIDDFGLQLVCITRGCKGSLLVNRQTFSEQPSVPVRVADTVGAGDAFTAAMVHEFLHGASLEVMGETANLVGAWVASQSGPTPVPTEGVLQIPALKNSLLGRFAS